MTIFKPILKKLQINLPNYHIKIFLKFTNIKLQITNIYLLFTVIAAMETYFNIVKCQQIKILVKRLYKIQ